MIKKKWSHDNVSPYRECGIFNNVKIGASTLAFIKSSSVLPRRLLESSPGLIFRKLRNIN